MSRRRDGTYRIELPEGERALLRALPGQLQSLLRSEPADPSLRRLFPPAYPVHPDNEQEYRELVGEDLLDGHLSALKLLASTADAETLDEEQLVAWMRALNQLRLVLGTRLDVDDESSGELPDPGDPDAEVRNVFIYLGWLQEQVVSALSVRGS
ncbi:MAG TPA: DUF2017 family protein [Acidimicrobiales bacterium]|nr:DUF2017 family protein [Acidimicrobiales bacterium]